MSFGRLPRAGAARPPRPLHDINVTPLVDVMLVLLVIFMVTAPLLASRLKLDLPEAEAGAATGPGPGAVLAVAISADGTLRLGEAVLAADTAREQLEAAARAAVARSPDAELELRADQAVPYGRVAELIGWVQAAGLLRIGLVTQPPESAAQPAAVAPSAEPPAR